MIRTAQQLIDDRIQNLHQNTDFVSTIFQHLTGYAIIAADFDGGIIAYNEGARHMYGHAPLEVVGKQNMALLFRRDFVEAGSLQRIIDSLLEEGMVSFEPEMARKNGEYFPARVLFTLTRDKRSKVVGFIGIMEDLTAIKRAEQVEAEYHAQTARRIEELEEERRSMERMSSSGQLSVTASLYGSVPLEKTLPDVVERLSLRYEELLHMALENRAFKVEHNISEGLHSMAQQLGSVRAGPRDVFDVYRSAIKRMTMEATTQKANAIVEEGRLTLLELLGYLVFYYRSYASRISAVSRVEVNSGNRSQIEGGGQEQE